MLVTTAEQRRIPNLFRLSKNGRVRLLCMIVPLGRFEAAVFR